MICKDTNCVFHSEDKTSCLLPDDQNLYHCIDGVVESCINRMHDEDYLSKEGKALLKSFKSKEQNK